MSGKTSLPLTHAQRMHAAGAQVERLTNDVDALRAAMRAILNMEGADGMTAMRASPAARWRPLAAPWRTPMADSPHHVMRSRR